jgi:hypothetical protein
MDAEKEGTRNKEQGTRKRKEEEKENERGRYMPIGG